jgi:uncharacterized protein
MVLIGRAWYWNHSHSARIGGEENLPKQTRMCLNRALTKGDAVSDFEFRTELPVSAAEAFRWHARPGAFLRLSPPWGRVELERASGGIENGARLVMRLGTPPISVRWTALHRGYEDGRRFIDEQETGPFARWVHEHQFEDWGPGRSRLLDRIEYTIPFGAAGELVGGAFVRRSLTRLFRYRGAVTAGDLSRHAPYLDRPKLKIAITGASGLVGTQLAAFLTTGGHEVVRVARGRIDHEALEGQDAVVHLAGENIAGGRWTDERKAEILASRSDGTKRLAEALTVLRTPPGVFLSASAVGYYGYRGGTTVDEGAAAGAGFLADVVRAWEDATAPARSAGIRTVNMRFGMIVTSRGGALAKMRLPFALGLGGPVGDGRQGVSWIALDDAIYAIHHLIRNDSVRGPVNVVAPDPLPQRDFATALGRALHRPAFVPLPAPAVKALFGQLGEEVLLGGQFVQPTALLKSGFTWSVARLDDALSR